MNTQKIIVTKHSSMPKKTKKIVRIRLNVIISKEQLIETIENANFHMHKLRSQNRKRV